MQKIDRSWIWIILQAVLTALLVCLLYWGYLIIQNPRTFPIKDVKVTAAGSHVPLAQIQETIKANLDGGFFTVSTRHISEAIQKNAWVENVEISRIWPNTLSVTVLEKQAKLKWNDADLISDQGKLFTPPADSIPKNLPALQGPEDSFQTVYDKYQLYQSMLQNVGLSLTLLSENARLSWQMQLNNGITVFLGSDNLDRRFAEFVALYPRLIGEKANKVQYVDMRYPNGVAIKWDGQ